jgi:hypothetical protein
MTGILALAVHDLQGRKILNDGLTRQAAEQTRGAFSPNNNL